MSDQPTALRLADELSRPWPRSSRQAAIELRRLHEEVEALRADAERYRWLRDAPKYSAPFGSLVDPWLFNRPAASSEAFDSAIDAAIDAARSKT